MFKEPRSKKRPPKAISKRLTFARGRWILALSEGSPANRG